MAGVSYLLTLRCFLVGDGWIDWIRKIGADAPIPPNTMNVAAPDGAPLRRIGH